MRRSRVAVAFVTVLAATTAATGASGAGRSARAVIPLPPGWQPEGIAAGNRGELYVGSIPTGRVLRLDPRSGATTEVVPRRAGRAAIGLKVAKGRLFVAGGPTGHAFVYDARTGADIVDVPLTAAPTFVNDVTVTRGAAWFTDSARRQLYRLPIGRDGAPAATARTVPITGDLVLDDDPGTFEANGIAATRDGRTLLVVQTRTAKLFAIDAATGASREVPITGGDGAGLVNGDGLLLDGRTLYAVQNQSNRIAKVRLARDLRRGTIVRYLTHRRLDVPTTVATSRSGLFAVNARFGTEATPTTAYDVVRVERAKRRARRAGRHR
jgi:sugar lactone lactonase YvrE